MTITEHGYVRLRRGSAAQWAVPAQGIPQDGELIVNTDLGVIKLGDGSTPEASLLPIGGGGGGGAVASVDGQTGTVVLTSKYGQLAADNVWAASHKNVHRGQVIIRADDLALPLTNGVINKPLGDGTVAPWWLVHDDTDGYLIHMGPGPNFGSGYTGGGLALIGMGTQATNQNGIGILIDNRGTAGVNGPGTTGLVVTNFPTTSAGAVSLLQQGTYGRANTLLQLQQLTAGGSPLLALTNPLASTSTPGQQLAYFQDGSTIGDAGEIRNDTGEINWNRGIKVQGAHLTARDWLGSADISRASLMARLGYHPTFRDGVTTAASTTLTSATAKFTAADTGLIIYGGGIPAGTTMTYVNATTITLSNPASTTATGVEFTVYRPGLTHTSPALRLSSDSGDHATVYTTSLSSGQNASGFAIQTNSVAAAPGLETLDKTYLTGSVVAGVTYLGLYGTAPIAQQNRLGQLTDSSGGTFGVTVTAPGASYSQTDEANFRKLVTVYLNGIDLIFHKLGITA